VAAAATLLLLAASPVPVAEAAPRTCAGKQVTIVGTSGDDNLRGTRGNDVIDGLGGSDVINGLQGRDTICGNYGADDLRGNAGNDRLYGGKDALTFDGAQSTARIGDTLNGGSGDDVIVPGFDPRDGFVPPEGPIDDVDDLITYYTAPDGVRVNLATGVATGHGTDRLVVNGRIRLFTTTRSDVVVGSPYDDEISLFAGNDRVSDGAGDDLMFGYGGTDTRVVEGGGADGCISIEVNADNC
jgi:Ca2+-binding RTX toxin-like protein